MSVDKASPSRGAWRPIMPRKAKAILLDARELSSEYGWTDEALASVHAARDAGWTLQEIGDVLGCTREYVRQLYEKDVDPAVEVVGFPQKPKRPKAPKAIPGHVLRRGLVSPEEIVELAELQKVASRRRSNGNPAAVLAAEELWRRVNDLVDIGVPHTWLSRQMGMSAGAVRFGLARYGYRPGPPSQTRRRTGSVGDPA